MRYDITPDPRINRRAFLGKAASGVGAMALATLLNPAARANGLPDGLPHYAPKARRMIYLFQSGGPAQMDLYDYKPGLRDRRGEDVPASIYPDERKTTMSSGQAHFPVAPSIYDFQQHGESGIWMSELLPHTANIADDLCVVKSMYTEAINHDPAITMLQTGSQLPGRPSIGAWLSYGLGSENENLPAFVAMNSRGKGQSGGQPLYDRLWGQRLPARRAPGREVPQPGRPGARYFRSARREQRHAPRDAGCRGRAQCPPLRHHRRHRHSDPHHAV